MINNEMFVHIKTGNLYLAVGEAINSTNGEHEDETMIIYANESKMIFVREKKEFLEKFKSAEVDND